MRIGIDTFDPTLIDRWRPIDDDARNGSEYLIGWMELEGQTHMAVAFWNATKKCWVGEKQYTTEPNWQPTHYMVLPAPPWSRQ